MTIMRIMMVMYVYALVSDLETFRRITNQFSFFLPDLMDGGTEGWTDVTDQPMDGRKNG